MDIEQAIDDICRAVSGIGGLGGEHDKIHKSVEANLAVELAASISKLPFRRGEGGFFHFNGLRYEKLTDDDMRQIIVGVMYRMEIGNVYIFGSVSGIMRLVASDYRIKVFKPTKSLISFNNCMLRLSDMKTMPHHPDLATRIHLDYDYDPRATCPTWIRFLNGVISDTASIQIFQEFLGLVFIDTAQVNIEASMFLYGTGANGKSTAQDIIETVVGRDYCTNYELSQLCTASDAGYNLSDINGKLLNFAADMGDKDFSGGRFKALAARDPIQVRPIGQAPFKATDLPLMISSINKMPHTTDATDGYWRRFLLIHFDKTFMVEDQDRTMRSKLRREIAGVFNWIIMGRKRLLENGGKFTESIKMNKQVNEARTDSNSVLSFLEEQRYTSKKSSGATYEPINILSRDLMDAYQRYCKVWGNKPKSKKGFYDDLTSKGFEYRSTMHTRNGVSTGWVVYKKCADFGSEMPDYDENPIAEKEELELPF